MMHFEDAQLEQVRSRLPRSRSIARGAAKRLTLNFNTQPRRSSTNGTIAAI
jgi:hypothetical protein